MRSYGAVGDGEADDWGAITAAISAAKDGGGGVYIPPGEYRCGDSLILDGGNGGIPRIFGDGLKSTIRFSRGGFLRPDTGSAGGWQIGGIEKLYIISNDPTSWAIDIQDIVAGFYMRDLIVDAVDCIRLQHTFDWHAHNISCRGSRGVGIGFVTSNHGVLSGYNAAGKNIGMVLDGMGVVVSEARIEECRTAIQTATGINGYCISNSVHGVTIESTLTGIDVKTASHTTFDGVHILGYSTTSYGPSKTGLNVDAAEFSQFSGFRIAGEYTMAGIRWAPRESIKNELSRVSVSAGAVVPFDCPGQRPRIVDCENIAEHDPSRVCRTGSATIAADATEVLLAFPKTLTSPGACDQNGAPTSTTGTLPDGGYEYSATIADVLGVYPTNLDLDAQPFTATDGGAVLTFFNSLPADVERRIYRRGIGGDWWGYFVQPDSGRIFTDSGQDFDGFGGIPRAGALRGSYYGDDTDYKVTLTPEFEAAVWVKERRSDGILIGLSSGHSGGTLRWVLEN